MSRPRRAVVVGGGIGGLTTAIGLRQAGVETLVLERRAEPGKLLTGGGFMLWHNAFLALRQVKLDSRVAAAGSRIRFHEFRSDRDRRLARWHIDPETERIGAPAVALRRSALNTILRDAAGDSLRLGVAYAGFEQDRDGVTVRLGDGTEERVDVLVGADGVRSAVRRDLRHGYDGPPRYAGYTAWQAITPLPGEDVVPSGTFFNLWGRNGLRFLYCRLSPEEVYWDAITSDRAAARLDVVGNTRVGVLAEAYRSWPDPVPRIIASTPEDAVLPIDIADRPPDRDPAWHAGRVVLVGDAAHPMTLNLSQGAGQSIEDGVVLSRLLSEGDDVPAALAEYERLRRARATAMVAGSWQIGLLGRLHGRVSCGLRDLFMRSFFDTIARRESYKLMMGDFAL